MARFMTNGKVYEMAELDEVTPRDLLTFPRDASEAMGRSLTFNDVQRIGREINALPQAERESHPDFPFLMTVVLWVSRRAGGDKITYGECLDEPFSIVPDEPSGKAPAAKKAAKKQPAKGKRKSGNPAVRAAAG